MTFASARQRRQVAWLLAATFVPLTAHGELWSVENNVESRFESNDNLYLAQRDRFSVTTVNFTDTLQLSRQSESASTRATLATTALRSIGGGEIERVDGRIGLSQTITAPLDLYTLQALYARDFNDSVQSADVTLGRGRRRATTVAGSWQHSYTERLRTTLQTAYVRTAYGQRLGRVAADFDDASASAGVDYSLSEIDTMTVRAGRSRYATRVGGSTSTSDDVSLGVSRVLSEQGSVSLSLGYYRTMSQQKFYAAACPVDVAFCRAGLVAYQPFIANRRDSSSGFQFDAKYRHQFDERTSLVFAAARKQAPSGTGTVVTSDTLDAAISRAVSETFSVSLAYAQSRARFETAGVGSTAQRAVTASMTKRLSDDASLVATYQRTWADLFGGAGSAQSNSVSVSARLDWPRVEASR